MAKSTRHSRRGKPGVTIDGTAEDKTAERKAASQTAPGGSAANKPTDAGANTARKTTTTTSGGGAASGKTTSGDGASGSDASSKASGDSSTSSSSASSASENAKADASANSMGSSAPRANVVPPSKEALKEPAKPEPTVKPDASKPGSSPSGPKMGSASSVKTDSSAPADDKAAPGSKTATGRSETGSDLKAAAQPGRGSSTATPAPAGTPAKSASAASASRGKSERSGDERDGKKGGTLGALAAGLLGGIIALGGAWALGAFSNDTSVADATNAEIVALRERIEAVETVEPVTAGPDEAAIAAIVENSVAQSVPALVDERIAEAVTQTEGGGSVIDQTVITSLDDRLSALEVAEGQRLEAGGLTPEIEARIAQLEGAPGTDPQTAETLSVLQAQLESLSGAQGAAEGQVAALLSQLESENAASAQVEALVAEVNGRLDEIASGSGEVRTSITGLDQRLTDTTTAIEGEIAAVRTSVEEVGGGVESVRNGISNVRSEIDGVRSNVEDVTSSVEALRGDLDGATGRLEDLSGRIDDVSSRVDQVATSVDQNASQLNELATVVEESRSDTTIARAFAATNLRNAIDRGTSFAAELESYTAVAADPGAVDALREFAGRGVPTVAELVDRFPTVARDVIASDIEVEPDAGPLDRILGSARRNLVTVRPTGEQAGDGTGAVLARMEEALKAGDLDRALAEGETLDPAPREAAEPFLENVRARRAANDLIDNALADAMRPADAG